MITPVCPICENTNVERKMVLGFEVIDSTEHAPIILRTLGGYCPNCLTELSWQEYYVLDCIDNVSLNTDFLPEGFVGFNEHPEEEFMAPGEIVPDDVEPPIEEEN